MPGGCPTGEASGCVDVTDLRMPLKLATPLEGGGAIKRNRKYWKWKEMNGFLKLDMENAAKPETEHQANSLSNLILILSL